MEGYAFLDAAGCGAANGDNPFGIATTVSTKKDNCHVNFLGVDYANWKALVAAFPTARTADAASFVISDVAGDYNVLPRSFRLGAEKPEQGKGPPQAALSRSSASVRAGDGHGKPGAGRALLDPVEPRTGPVDGGGGI